MLCQLSPLRIAPLRLPVLNPGAEHTFKRSAGGPPDAPGSRQLAELPLVAEVH